MSNRPNRKSSPSQRVAAAQRSSRGGTWWIWGILAVVLVAALAVTAVVVSRNDSSTASGGAPAGSTVVPNGQLAYGDVGVQGTNLPAAPQPGEADPAIGMAVPALTGESFDGAAMTIPASGRPKVVMFVAHWCPHCQKEVPIITDHLRQQGMPQGVDLYAVATGTNDQQKNYPPASWLNKVGWPVPTMVDTEKGKAAEAYGVNGFPFFVAVGADGKVVARTSGEITMEQFDQLVDAARTGQPVT